MAGDDLNDLIASSNNAQIKYDNVVTTIPDTQSAGEFLLKQNYPNPVNAGKTIIEFTLPEKAQAELSIFNSIGQKIFSVFNAQMNAGSHQVSVDVGDLGNGIYFYQLKTGSHSAVMKMVVH